MRKSHKGDYPQKFKDGGSVMKMKSGGKVRGCGMAKKGAKKAKMY